MELDSTCLQDDLNGITMDENNTIYIRMRDLHFEWLLLEKKAVIIHIIRL